MIQQQLYSQMSFNYEESALMLLQQDVQVLEYGYNKPTVTHSAPEQNISRSHS